MDLFCSDMQQRTFTTGIILRKRIRISWWTPRTDQRNAEEDAIQEKYPKKVKCEVGMGATGELSNLHKLFLVKRFFIFPRS